jgi:hypothetical protein
VFDNVRSREAGAAALDVRARENDSSVALPCTWASAVTEAAVVEEIVERTLAARALSVIYGESSSGKTYFALDLACHIALGREWLNRRTRKGIVVYVAAEAGKSILNRILAFKRHYQIEDLPVAMVTCPVDLLDPTADAQRLIALVNEIKRSHDEDVVLIIIDTLSRAMAGGNENAPEDMGAIVRNADRIRDQTGAHVCWVHHSGKDLTRGARGHSLLRAAVDTEIEVTAGDGVHRARITKQRDGPAGEEFVFKLLPIEVGQSCWESPLTACVVVPTKTAGAGRRRTEVRLPKGTGPALQALREVIEAHGQPLGETSVAPGGLNAVTGREWRRRYETLAPLDQEDDSPTGVRKAELARRRRFERARDALQDGKIVGCRNDLWWIW